MSSPIPFILCGKIPGHTAAVREVVKPEYEVIEVCNSAQALATTLRNASPKPMFIIMGGGFDRAEFDEARGVPGATSVPWLRPKITKPGNEHLRPADGKAPPAEVVAAGARKGIDEHIDAIMAGEGKEEVWYY